jgi:hypothetical protein
MIAVIPEALSVITVFITGTRFSMKRLPNTRIPLIPWRRAVPVPIMGLRPVRGERLLLDG